MMMMMRWKSKETDRYNVESDDLRGEMILGELKSGEGIDITNMHYEILINFTCMSYKVACK